MDGAADLACAQCFTLIICLSTLRGDELVTSLVAELRLTDTSVVAITCDVLCRSVELDVALVV